MKTETKVIKFEPGNIHYMSYIGDSNLKPKWICTKRTAKTVTFDTILKEGANFKINQETITRKIRIYNGEEYIVEGCYSMAPSIHAKKVIG